jgi:hypothetical protein
LQTSYKDEARKNQEKFKVLISLDCVWNRFCLAPPPPPPFNQSDFPSYTRKNLTTCQQDVLATRF